LGSSCTGLPNNSGTSECVDFAIFWSKVSPVNKEAEFCEAKVGTLRLNVVNGTEADEVAESTFAVKAGNWPKTEPKPTTVFAVVVTAVKELEANREAATLENDCTSDAEHDTPNILLD